MIRAIHLLVAGCLLAAVVVGCAKPAAEKPPAETDTDKVGTAAELSEGLVALSPEDQKLAIAQKICPVSGEALGSMGKPPKITLAGTEIFLCCKGCEDTAKADPKGTLAKLPK